MERHKGKNSLYYFSCHWHGRFKRVKYVHVTGHVVLESRVLMQLSRPCPYALDTNGTAPEMINLMLRLPLGCPAPARRVHAVGHMLRFQL